MKDSIRRELRFPQAVSVVWHALANREALAAWMYPNDFEPRIGHRFTFRVPPKPQLENGLVVQCEVLTCVPPRELSFSWVVEDFLNTRVSYRLEPDGSGTRVIFEHSGFDQVRAFKGAQYGWTMMHAELQKILERQDQQREGSR
jgi:uncharacterized protein YndB with AHSA1/START domain